MVYLLDELRLCKVTQKVEAFLSSIRDELLSKLEFIIDCLDIAVHSQTIPNHVVVKVFAEWEITIAIITVGHWFDAIW